MLRGILSLGCVSVVILLWAVGPAEGEDLVPCVVHGSCVLPCSFQAASEELIHWIYVSGNQPVHSYYKGQDRLDHQYKQFRGRTSLFLDNISEGNASLSLTRVAMKDAGRYKCYTSTTKGNKESFITLKVDAPVQKVNIWLEGNTIMCTSSGIFPEPWLKWTVNSSTQDPQDPPTVQIDNLGLYSINSSLANSYGTQAVYVCSVGSDLRTTSATLRQLAPVHGSSSSSVSIPCSNTTSTLKDVSLSWSFDHVDPILTYLPSQTKPKIQEDWRELVKGVSESGSLELHALTAKNEGTYTCELNNGEHTYVTITALKLMDPDTDDRNSAVQRFHWWIVPLVLGLLILTLVAIFGYLKVKGNRPKPSHSPEQVTELQTVKDATVDKNRSESSPLTAEDTNGHSAYQSGYPVT